MKNLFLFLCIFIAFQLTAQKKTIEYTVHNKKYLLGNNFYEFNDLEPYFKNYENTKLIWNKYNNRRQSGNFFAGLGGALFLLSAVQKPPSEDMYCDLVCINPTKAWSFIGGVISSVIGLGLHVGKEKFKPRLIDGYNAHFEQNMGQTEFKPDLEIGVSSKGVGLRLNF